MNDNDENEDGELKVLSEHVSCSR